MARRRVAVEFVAEMAQFKRGTKEGADEVRKLKTESKQAQAEVAKLGRESTRAQAELSRFAKGGRSGLVDLGAATRSLREDMSGLATRTRKAAESFAAVNGTARAALSTFDRMPAVLARVQRQIKDTNFKGALQATGGVVGAAGAIGNAVPKSTALGLAAIPAAAGAASAALQGIPPLLAAVGGGLGAIPALAAGAAGSLGTLKLATAGLGDSIEEIFAAPDGADPYDRLSASGKRFVDVIASQRTALMGLQRVAQDRVFAGLDSELQILGATALPFATRQVDRFGETWNQTFRQLARVGRDPEFLSGLDVAFESTDRFFDNINTRIPATSKTLAHLFKGSQPFVDAFGDSLLTYVDDFNTAVDRAAANGDLTEFFRDAGQQADALLDIGKEVLILVGRIGGMQQGSSLLRDMADALERFNDQAQNARSIEGIIATGNAAIRGLVQVLAVLGETLGETLADPATRDAIVAFFDVLTVAAQIVGNLVQAFSALPDPLQSALLVMAGLAIAMGKLQSVGGKVHDTIGRVQDRLGGLGPTGARAADGLGRTERALGRVGVALVATQVASAVFGSSLNPQIDALSLKLGEFAESGDAAGEVARLFGDDMGKLDTALKDVADTGRWSSVARGIAGFTEGLTGLGSVMDDSLTKSKERLTGLDQALTSMVGSGNAQGAADAFAEIAKRAAEQGVSVKELNAVLPGYAAAVETAKAEGDGYAAAVAHASLQQQILSGTMDDAIGTMRTYTRVWAELNGLALGTDEAMLAANEALKAVKESFKENGNVIKGNSTAALENRVRIGEMAEAAANAAQKKYEETGSIEAANAVYNNYIAQLRKTLDQIGVLTPEVDALISSYGRIPPAKTTWVKIEKKQAETDLKYIKRLSDAIKDKTVVISVFRNEIVTRSEGRNVPIGNVGGRRWGGITEYAQDGLINLRRADIYSAVPTARYGFAEAATGGEAFIPKFGARERSVSIGQRAMEWYGMDVVPQGGMQMAYTAGLASAAAPNVDIGDTYVIVEIDGQQLEGRIQRVVRDGDRNLKRRVAAGAGARR